MWVQRLNQLKKEKSLTNEKISEISGVNLSTIEKIMSGSSKNPTISTIKAVCDAVGCTVGYIMDDSSEYQISGEDLINLRKFQYLDDYGRKAVVSVLDVEYERCSGKNNLSESVNNFNKAVARSDGGGQKIKDIPQNYENIEIIEDL